MSQVRVHPSPAEKETNAGALSSPATTTLAQDNGKCFTKQLSFGAGDEFFHGMLSYRVNSEGPNGNNLALLLWDSCCQSGISSRQNSKADEAIQQSIDAVNQFGKWPRIFPHPSSSGVRIFLDQKNLRPGFDWKGTGNRADGGFLGALSSSLTLVPLLSATPARFKIKPTGSEGRFEFTERGNFAIQEQKPLDIFCESVGESSSGNKETKQLLCTDFRSHDSSFILKSVGEEALKPESVENASFWTSSYILPSDGSGPKGSVSEMLTIMQTEEDLSFHVKRSSGFVTLEVVELSDHVFFKTEKILLQLDQNSKELHEFAIDTVKVQGSKIGKINSVIQFNCGGENSRLSEANVHAIRGKTKAIDRKDNVLIEFMLARALFMIFDADTNPHPCKIILPVFVDDISVILGTTKCLSTRVSRQSADDVKTCLLQILKKDAISLAEEQKLIDVSIKDVVQFFSNLQGCQLSKGEARSMTMEAKAELVRSSILTTVGIEAALYACEQYVTNNPLAHELLDFIKQQDIGHIELSLVKFDVTSVKTFSKLSSESIKSIAEDSLVISKKSIVREIADITCAIDAAKENPLVWPVSQRLAKFEDKDASFMTIIYSTFAMEQALTKPLFGQYLLICSVVVFFLVSVYQVYIQDYAFVPVNIVRVPWLILIFYFANIKKSLRLARSIMWTGFIVQGLAGIFGVFVVDKFLDGRIVWDRSVYCLNTFSASQWSNCTLFLYSYTFWQLFFYFLLAFCICLKQEWSWRCWVAGASIQGSFSLGFQVAFNNSNYSYDAIPVVCFPILLIATEFLKFYGTLKAIRSTERGKVELSKMWDDIMKMDETSLNEIATFVFKRCSCSILDRSKDLGKWKANEPVWAEPPKLHQLTSDFDELYLKAAHINDCFQMWIESLFLDQENTSNFIYNMKPHIFEPLLEGKAIRGPVKRPHRAIAKVCQPFHERNIS